MYGQRPLFGDCCAVPTMGKGMAMLFSVTQMLWSKTKQDMAVTASAKGVGAAKATACGLST